MNGTADNHSDSEKSGIQTSDSVKTPSLDEPHDNNDFEIIMAEGELTRRRERTFPYFKHLPYEVEPKSQRLENLPIILQNIYVAIEAGDYAPGVAHHTRELRNWIALKYDPPISVRAKLVKLYYELGLAPGMDSSVAERFASMFMVLTRKKHYLRPGIDLTLPWRPLFDGLKTYVLPSDGVTMNGGSGRRNVRTLTKLCSFAQAYFDPDEIPAIFEEILPYFTTSSLEGAFSVIGLLNLLLPTSPGEKENKAIYPQEWLPTLFHLWSLLNRSNTADVAFLDLLSRLARDLLTADHVPFNQFGIFTDEQSQLIFTAVLRLLEIPVGQATSPYNDGIDMSCGNAIYLNRDSRKHPIAHHIARFIVMSLSPVSAESEVSTMSRLEGLIQGIETFFHPSNSGGWTKTISQLVYYMADFFVMRWNREASGEMEVPEERKLTQELKSRFVLCLREVTFMGIFAKSGTAMNYALSTLQCLALLEPSLILPGALQRIYPALQGLVEVHRTSSSLRSLQILTRIIARTKGFRCHLTTLLGFALPGIDANDLDKSLQTLSFIQSVAYNIPIVDLTKDEPDSAGSSIAVAWITAEVEKMETEGVNVEMNYHTDLSDEDERTILRSSTAAFGEFIISFIGRVFTLLENLPDASRVRSGSPEENVVNTLPAAMTPLLAAMSPDLYDIALNKIANFVSSQVVHQARDAMAFVVSAVCRINPEKALKRFIPMLITNIRTEIDDNGAASTRHTGVDVLPRDRALIWHVSMLSMSVALVGKEVLRYKDELLDIAEYMQRKCKGIPTVHISNFIHHLLLNLTCIYTTDYSLFEKSRKVINEDCWGMTIRPDQLNVSWHKPEREEIEFAVELYQRHSESALARLESLISENPPIKREGTAKEWSDEVSRNLVLLRLILSGVSILFDPQAASQSFDTEGSKNDEGRLIEKDDDIVMGDSTADATAEEDDFEAEEDDAALGDSSDDMLHSGFKYAAGYAFPDKVKDPLYTLVHKLRERTGRTLHHVHKFLSAKQEDDVPCFNALYTAYRSWFVDVGIERSAHVLDRVTKLFNSDVHPFKVSGLRKEYPRPLLVRRANVFHLQRVRHNAGPRKKSPLDILLLQDLTESTLSQYTDIRKHAQGAAESAIKVVMGSRRLMIPPLLDGLKKAIQTNDFPRIKGALYGLLFGSLAKTVAKDWRFAPTMIKLFISVSNADRPSVQKLAASAMFHVMEYGRPLERLVLIDDSKAKDVYPTPTAEDEVKIEKRRVFVQKKRDAVEQKKADLAVELVELAKTSHWKIASRTISIMASLGLRFETIAPPSLIELVVKGTINEHPSLRGIYAGGLVALLCLIEMRARCNHDYKTYILDEAEWPTKIVVDVDSKDPLWTQKFLSSFAQADTKYYVDADHYGWLVWGKKITAYIANPEPINDYDVVETKVREQLGKVLNRKWFSSFFGYLKQEPKDTADKFRMTSAVLLTYVFEMVMHGVTVATYEEIKEEIELVYEDGSDKNQHRATAEILGALVTSITDDPVDIRNEVMGYVFPFVHQIFQNNLTPENSTYWMTFLQLVMQGKDPRRIWPLVDSLAAFRLDIKSNAAFKESSQVQLLQRCVAFSGWHFQLENPILQDFLAHLDHPYKGVREAVGHTLASIYRSRYHESYPNVSEFMQAQRAASAVGVAPYKPTAEFCKTIETVFNQIVQWRKERPPGQQTQSSYTSGSKTVLLWLDTMLCSQECTQLLQFFPHPFMEEMLHMMDVKEDPELMSLAYHVFRHIPNIPHPVDGDADLISSLTRIGRTSTSWHQRLRVLINMQVIYFRRLFLMRKEQQQALFNCVADMLEDPQLEVRLGAATTLSGLIRCSPVAFRDSMVAKLKKKFAMMLRKNPLLKRTAGGTPTPEHNKIVLTRHAAVLGLGALIQAFPYMSPPAPWVPEILATLALKASVDPGMVGKSVKSILSDFKKTRQDTWHVDVKVFTSEQLEDLEGVLWKSYFA